MEKTLLKNTIVACALFGLTQVSNAGTMGPVSSAPSWAGAYAGLNAGAFWGSTNFYTDNYGSSNPSGFGTFLNQYVTTTIDDAGLLAGGQIGYNFDFGSYVLGIEGDFDYNNYNNNYHVMTPVTPGV